MKPFRRWRVFADFPLQGALCLRLGAYWGLCIGSVSVILVWRTALGTMEINSGGPGTFWQQYAAVILVPFLLLPMVMVESLIWSNRFIGPLRRVRGTLTQLANGESIHPLRFRRNDMLVEMAADLNIVAERLRQMKTSDSVAEPAPLAASQDETTKLTAPDVTLFRDETDDTGETSSEVPSSERSSQKDSTVNELAKV